MLTAASRLASRAVHTSARLSAAAEGAAASTATKVTLNLATPYQAFFEAAEVDLVQIPGVEGEYGVTARHTPVISQLKPGVIKVHVDGDKDVQSFFTAGGFALTHANSVTDIACAELVKLEDVDAAEADAGLKKFQAALAAATSDADKFDAQVGLDVHQALVAALASN